MRCPWIDIGLNNAVQSRPNKALDRGLKHDNYACAGSQETRDVRIGRIPCLRPRLCHLQQHPRYVVMFADAFHEMEESLADARIAATEADIKAGRVTRGTADELMAELLEG